MLHLQGTVYAIPAIALRVMAVLTNTTPIGVTRGPGFAETVNIMERLIDAAARQCGFDRVDLRRRNFVPAEAMPMTNAFGFVGGQRRISRRPSTARWHWPTSPASRRAAAHSEARGKLRGLGFAYHIKATGGSPHENVDIRFEDDGSVSLITGTQTIGQGHETTFPQILADRLGIAERAHPSAPGRHRPDPDRRRPWQLARHLHGRHGDLARVGRRSSPRAGASPPTSLEAAEAGYRVSPTATSSSPAPTCRCGLLDVAAHGARRRARRSTRTTPGRAST